MAAILGPMFLTGALIAIDMRSDLSGLKARPGSTFEGVRVFGWSDLQTLAPGDSLPARMLGYMMDGYKPVPDDTPVETFVLMPDAGHLLHPAHRESAEMVEVWLPLNTPIRYLDRRLVWVWGDLRRKKGAVAQSTAAFTLSGAAVRLAGDREISEWFQP